ncbi:MAG: peptidoglycan DD-metalloendopeptidase family protein [Cyanobacteria bacterium REEB444]|nr:peptidoglycan DD-metalloendopeptidase family protein [Cyanobacteria bacterium REEB444]
MMTKRLRRAALYLGLVLVGLVGILCISHTAVSQQSRSSYSIVRLNSDGNEGDRHTFRIVRTGNIAAAGRVWFSTSNDSAISGTDFIRYESVRNFAPKQKEDVVYVDSLRDDNNEGTERFIVSISKVNNVDLITTASTFGQIFNVNPPKTKPLPTNFSRVSQGFGVLNPTFGGYHTGYDIDTANSNPTVYSIADGTVKWNSSGSPRYKNNFDKYFNAFVIIQHGNFYAYYGHITSNLRENATVKKGSPIGSIRDAYNQSNRLNRQNNHLHISISPNRDWVRERWGYQLTPNGLNQFVNPSTYTGY